MQELSQAELVVQKHRGKWTVRQVGYDPSTGKRRVRQVGTFDTKKAANAYKDRVADGRVGLETDTVAGYVGTSWLTAIEPRVDESTFDQYSWAVSNHIVPLLGEVKLKDLTPELLDRWIRDLCLPADDGNPRLGLTSTRLVRKVLSMALADGVARGHLARNPVEATKPPRAQRAPKRKGWTFDEAKTFVEATRDHRLFPAFHLGLVTGLRRGEILGLDWDHVRLGDGVIEIVQQYVIVKGRPVLKPVPKTEASDRILAIGSRTVELLAEHGAKQATENGLLFGSEEHRAAVFTSEAGERVNPNTFTNMIRRLSTQAGVPPLTAKAFRHTANSIGRSVVGDDKIMQERLGHADISVTLGTYTHTVSEQHRKAGEQMDDLFA